MYLIGGVAQKVKAERSQRFDFSIVKACLVLAVAVQETYRKEDREKFPTFTKTGRYVCSGNMFMALAKCKYPRCKVVAVSTLFTWNEAVNKNYQRCHVYISC